MRRRSRRRPHHGRAGVAECRRVTAPRGPASLVASEDRAVCYTAFVQDQGWQSEVCDGELAGTVGQQKRMEAIKIRRTTLDRQTPLFIRYRTYLEGLGWQPYVMNNTEAIEILETPAPTLPPGGINLE